LHPAKSGQQLRQLQSNEVASAPARAWGDDQYIPVRSIGIKVDDAIEISEKIEI
jgi:hypothetical protein